MEQFYGGLGKDLGILIVLYQTVSPENLSPVSVIFGYFVFVYPYYLLLRLILVEHYIFSSLIRSNLEFMSLYPNNGKEYRKFVLY